jgi:hypothetical protein
LILLLSVLFSSCDKKNKIKTSGEDKLNSEKVLEGSTYSIPGFSFESGSVVLYNPAASQNIPDIFALPSSDAQGNVTGAYFDSQNINESFALVGEFSTSDSALSFFNDYKQVDANSFVFLAKPVLKNQVWVFKTRNEKYAKILILDVQAYLKNTEPFAEVTFKWVYQPDGSKTFIE